MARDVFWNSVRMRFVRMVVFRGQGAHFKRQQVADVVISQAGTCPGHGQIRKKRVFVENMNLAWAGAISKLSYAGALISAQDGGPRPVPKVHNWPTQKNSDFERKWRHPASFSLKMFLICLKSVYSSGKEKNRC